MIMKSICPVCGEKKIETKWENGKYKVRCNYCCHSSSANTKISAYKDLWKDAINADDIKSGADKLL